MTIDNSYSLGVVLKGIAEIGRRAIRMDFRADSCIASTRTVIRVLQHYGFHAEPLHVKVIIFNHIMLKHWYVGAVPNNETPEFREFCDRTGAWSVGLGYENPGQRPVAVGHLVAIMPQELRMIDASLDQADRPHKGIELPCPFIARITPEFLAEGRAAEYAAENQGSLRYIPDFQNQTYKESLDWLLLERTDQAVKTIIDHIRRTA